MTIEGTLLATWLHSKPNPKLFETWQHYTKELLEHLKPDQVQQLRDAITRRSREVAEATGGFLGIGCISDNEQNALDQVESAFDSH